MDTLFTKPGDVDAERDVEHCMFDAYGELEACMKDGEDGICGGTTRTKPAPT